MPGLALLVAIGATLLVIFYLDEAIRAAVEGPRLVVVTPEAPELEPGSAVWVAGRPAGRVTAVHVRERTPDGLEGMLVEAMIHREAAGAIREDAEARIHKSSLLGTMVLAIRPGSGDRPPYDFADTLRSTVALVDQDRAMALLDTVRAALAEARPLARRLGKELREGSGTLAALARDPGVLETLEGRVRRLGELLADGGPGSLGRLLGDTALPASLERTTEALRRLSEPEEGAAPPGRALEEALAALDRMQARLVRMEQELEAGHGSSGRALYDTAIAVQADLLRARLDSLRRELLEDPLRWLRFRIF